MTPTQPEVPPKYDDSYFESAIAKMPVEYQELMVSDSDIKSFPPAKMIPPDPSDYTIVQLDKENKPKCLDRTGCITFLRQNYIVAIGEEFRQFDGRRYAPLPEKSLKNLIIKSAWDSNMLCFVPKTSDVSDVYNTCNALLPHTIELPADMDSFYDYYDQPLMAFENGLFNFNTHKMLPFSPHVPVFHYVRANFDPSIKDAPARTIIEGIIPDPNTRAFMFEMIGYILFEPDLNPPAIFVLYGPAETGKSALANMIEALVGSDSVTHLDMKLLTAKFGPAEMENKWLNICTETGSESARTTEFNGEMLKAMSSGETITVQHKHGQPFQIKPTAKILFCTNTPPDFGDDSSGLYRRLYIIPCRQPQDSKQRIYDALKTPESLSWIVNHSYEAYCQFKANGSVFSQSALMDKEKSFFKSQNPMMDYLQTVFGTDNKDEIADKIVNDPELCYTTQLYASYSEYTHMTLSHPLSRKKFVERIRNEFALNIVNEGYYLPDGKHTTRDKYVKGRS